LAVKMLHLMLKYIFFLLLYTNSKKFGIGNIFNVVSLKSLLLSKAEQFKITVFCIHNSLMNIKFKRTAFI